MIPTKVAMSCDADPFYSDFWEPVSRMWRKKIGVEPVLFFVGKEADAPKNGHGPVVTVPPIEGIPLYLQAAWARFHFVQNFPEDTWIISDIDMIPLSPWYFKEQLKDVQEDCLVALNTDGKYFPACYTVARGSLLKTVWTLPDSFQESMTQLQKEEGYRHAVNSKVCPNWGADEIYTGRKIHEFRTQHPDKVVELPRPGGFPNGRRIDGRIHWSYSPGKVVQDWYLDCHSIRPYREHRDKIETLLLHSLSGKDPSV